MLKKIIIPTDGYGLEDHVIKYMARAFPFADFYIVSVIDTYNRSVQLTNLLYSEIKENAKKALHRAKNILEDEGIHNVKIKVLEGVPSRKIVEYTKKRDADLIALHVYSRKKTVSSQRIGYTVKNILKKSSYPVLTLTEECEKLPIKKILFATDGMKTSKRAKNFAMLLASSLKADLEVLYVVESGESEEHGNNILKNVEWKSSFLNINVKKSLEHGDAVEKILDHSKNNDLIIMGTGKTFLFWHYIGHVTQAVCTHSPIPVILVKNIKKRWKKRISRR